MSKTLKNSSQIKAESQNEDLYLYLVEDYALDNEAGNKLNIVLDSKTYKMKIQLINKKNEVINTSNEIDLPIEQMIKSITYDKDSKELVITMEDGTQIRVPISDLTENLVKEVDELISILPSKTVSSTNELKYDYANDYYVLDSTIKGNTERDEEPTPENPQEVKTLKGYNLINVNFQTITKNGITFTNNNDGSLTLNGTSNADFGVKIGDTLHNLLKGTYTLSKNGNLSSVSGAFLILYGSNGSNVELVNTINDDYKSFTTTTNYNDYWEYIYIQNNKTFNNYIIKPQLTRGTELKSYLPYNSIIKKYMPKNLFNLKKWFDNNFEVQNGTKIDVMDKGFTIHATAKDCFTKTFRMNATSSNFYEINNFGLEVDENTTYTFSYNKFGTGRTVEYVFYYDENYFYKSYELFVNAAGSPDDKKNHTFTTPAGTKYICIRFGVSDENDTVTFSDIQIEKGAIATKYQKFEEKYQYIYLGENEILADDTLKLDYKGNAVLNKKWGKVVFNGSENWSLGTGSKFNYFYRPRPADYFVGQKSVCNSFNYNANYTTNENSFYVGANNLIIAGVKVNGSYLSTVDQFKNWLSQNNVIIYYPLAEEQNIILDKVEPVKTIKGTNNVSVIADAEPTYIEEKYVFDTMAYLEDMASPSTLNLEDEE